MHIQRNAYYFPGIFVLFCTWNFDYLRNSTNTFCQRIFSEIDRIFQGIWYLTSILRTSYKQYMSPTGNKLVLKQLPFYVKNRTGKNSVIDFYLKTNPFPSSSLDPFEQTWYSRFFRSILNVQTVQVWPFLNIPLKLFYSPISLEITKRILIETVLNHKVYISIFTGNFDLSLFWEFCPF